MRYTKATNYALHIVGYMVQYQGKDNLTLHPLASHMNISPTYLSKILTQLVKADLIQSSPGVNGGYCLRKKRETITFFDVIQAIEGSGPLFTCELEEENCRFQKVMSQAENQMQACLQAQTIYNTVTSC